MSRIPDAKLCLCSTKDPGTILFTYELKNVMVTGFVQEGNQEKLSLNFEEIKFN
ncbi:MAG: type VI secretion system tube protein Hcp [Acidobacteria bacterium]|nr:type VI secretion system tube protein Hcp [Acidobacteriota bacterium]MBU4496371.1 type VI secretion system tube protein Hcp [Acidobacteriota bacterium]MCG2816270.1 type VI secretion system tube protein Hcp [Candidatus Aminicenantes bacterium]